MDPTKLIELESAHIMQTYKRFPIVFTKGEGCTLIDANEKHYLDFLGGIACVPVGHSNSDVSMAISKAASTLIHTCNLYYTEQQVLLAEKLSELTGLSKTFFCNSGAEAIEAAIKLAKRVSGKHHFICCENGFHGRTHGSLSATGKESIKKPFEPLLPEFSIIPFNDINALSCAITDQSAAFILELIQGEGGINVADMEYISQVAKLCKEKNVLLIVDEIQSGNGRSGHFCTYQHYGITPDIITLAKGLANGVPIGACLSNHEFQPGDHGTTFGGGELACSAANATLDYIISHNLMKNAVETGNYFMEELKTIPSFSHICGIGLMIGCDYSKDAKAFVDKCLEKGLVINTTREHRLRFLPALIVTKDQIDTAISIMKEVDCDV